MPDFSVNESLLSRLFLCEVAVVFHQRRGLCPQAGRERYFLDLFSCVFIGRNSMLCSRWRLSSTNCQHILYLHSNIEYLLDFMHFSTYFCIDLCVNYSYILVLKLGFKTFSFSITRELFISLQLHRFIFKFVLRCGVGSGSSVSNNTGILHLQRKYEHLKYPIFKMHLF